MTAYVDALVDDLTQEREYAHSGGRDEMQHFFSPRFNVGGYGVVYRVFHGTTVATGLPLDRAVAAFLGVTESQP